MLTKRADFAFTEVKPLDPSEINNTNGILIRTAANRIVIEPGSEKSSIIEAEIKKHPNALFFRAKAIEANKPNTNGDYFSVEELLKAYKSFEGVPFFTNHNNQNIENARGKVIFAEWLDDEDACYVLAFVDRDAYPDICRGIEQEYVTGVSMGFLGMDSEITMADLSSKKICEISIGDKVLTPMGNFCDVEKIYSDIIGTPMYELDLVTYHKSPLLSSDHPLYIIPSEQIRKEQKNSLKNAQSNKYLRRKNKISEKDFIGQDGWRNAVYKPEFKETQNCVNGDYVLVPSKYKVVEKENVDKDFWYLAGAYVGDGYLSKSNKGDKDEDLASLRYYIGLHEKRELGERIENLLPKFTKSNITKVEFPLKNGLSIGIYDRKICTRLFNDFGKLAHHKRIYKNDFSKEEITSFISGYIDTDGTIARNYNKKQNGDIRGSGVRGALISSCNQSLLEDVQSLLIAIDVPSYITWSHRLPNKNSLVKIPTLDFSLFIPYGNLHLFTDSIKVRGALTGVANSEMNAGKVFIFTGENGQKYMACPIKKIIQKQYDKPCYDLKIKDDECYIADGIAVHNCSVEYSICNICGNKAEKTDDYCSHIRNRKGRKFSGRARNVTTGQTKEFRDEPVFEYNFGLKFIELSAVVDPACPSCHIQGIISNDDYMAKVASLENSLFMVREAAIEKKASQEEIQQIDGVLQTLETIAVNLIKNRKQVEMEFASELVDILSQLQTWMDELVGAGYGNLPSAEVPGTVGDQPPEVPGAMPGAEAGLPTPPPVDQAGVAPMAASTTGVPTTSAGGVQQPNLPITTPIRPRADTIDSRTIQRVANYGCTPKYIPNVETRSNTGSEIMRKASDLCGKLNKSGDIEMGKRRTITAKQQEKEKVMEVLSNSWQEKQDFFEYIKQMPSIQDNEHRLLINKRDESFIVVGENKSNPEDRVVWTYEDLTDDDKKMIQASPKDASVRFLELFSEKSKKQKEGENIMTDINKNAGATTVNPVPQEVQEAQLRQKGLYHSQTDVEQNQITQAQLEAKRSGEKDYLTEKQLNDSELKLNPRQNVEPQEVQEAQLRPLREDNEKNTITQDQLNSQRKDAEPEVITERQLDKTPAPWARTADRDPSFFKSAADHMKSVITVLAEAVLAAGCAPDEACEVAASLVDSTKNRVYLASSILETSEDKDKIDFGKRIAFWNNKNLKVASTGKKEIAQLIVDGLRKVASDTTIDPDVLIEAVDVIGEGKEGIISVDQAVNEKIAEASAKEPQVNRKSELRAALKPQAKKEDREAERDSILSAALDQDVKMRREAERQAWEKVINKEAAKNADHMIETSFTESGLKKDDPSFKSGIVSFARGALASQSLKLAAVTNVTISGDTIQIAVQTDEGEEEVEIPIGDVSAPVPEETVPEGDLTGEGLENTLGTPSPAGATAPIGGMNPYANAKNKMTREAQAPMGGGMPGGQGGMASGAPEQGLPGPLPEGDAIQSLTEGDIGEEGVEDVPTIGEQQMPWTICPECGSSDVDVSNEDGVFGGKCNKCTAEFEALIKKNVEFTITKPTVSVGKPAGEEGGEDILGMPEAPAETPEVPSLPVAAQTRIDKGTIVRIAENREKHGHVCPACGHAKCEASKDGDGHSEFSCPACKTDVVKDIMISSSDPSQSFLRVRWDIRPNTECEGCSSEVAKFASRVKVAQMIRTAAANQDSFPWSNCVERMARQYGGNTVASFGPCKGKLLADCVCKDLQRLGFSKIKDMVRLANASMQKDPLDECVEDQRKKGHDIKEAKNICACLKKKFASELSDNIYAHAFGKDVVEGKELRVTAQDLATLYEASKEEAAAVIEAKKAAAEQLLDEDIGSDLPPLKEAEVEVEVVAETHGSAMNKKAGFDVLAPGQQNQNPANQGISQGTPKVCKTCGQPGVNQAGTEMTVCNTQNCPNRGKAIEAVTANSDIVVKEAKGFFCDKCNKPCKVCECPKDGGDDGEKKEKDEEKDKKEAMAMNGQRIRSVNEEVFNMASLKTASTPKKVKDIEGNVEAGVPRSQAYMGEEANADSMINQTPKAPVVPRSDAYMGHERDADSMINAKLKLPDVAVDSSYMGKEKEVQSGMPAINNEIKGTVIATDNKTTKQAKQMKEIDTVESNVEAGVPRSDAKMGEEAKAEGHINAPNKGPDVPRSDAYMGHEKDADSLINENLKGPDVPIDNAYMGKEKEVQSDMPGINSEILKQVQMQREEQLSKISQAREKQAMKVASWLVGNGRIANDLEAFDATVKALSAFEIDKIVTVASMLFPEKQVKTSSVASQEVRTASAESHGIPAIVMESKNKSAQDTQDDFVKKLAGAFTVGNRDFDHKLTLYGERE